MRILDPLGCASQTLPLLLPTSSLRQDSSPLWASQYATIGIPHPFVAAICLDNAWRCGFPQSFCAPPLPSGFPPFAIPCFLCIPWLNNPPDFRVPKGFRDLLCSPAGTLPPQTTPFSVPRDVPTNRLLFEGKVAQQRRSRPQGPARLSVFSVAKAPPPQFRDFRVVRGCFSCGEFPMPVERNSN